MRREDLLALDEARLASLTNRGLVRRAARMLTEGEGPTLRVEHDGTVVARSGEEETRLPAGAPFEASTCTCDARGMCRHRVVAVLAYRAGFGATSTAGRDAPEPPSVAAIDDAALRARLGPWALRRAARRRDAGLRAVVHRGDPLRVELPTCAVRFVVPGDLAYARCDCRRERCAHLALAVWAARAADARDPEARRVEVQLGPPAEAPRRALAEARDLLRELLVEGTESAAGLPGRLRGAGQALGAAGLRWPAELCAELEEDLEAYAARAAGYRPAQLARRITELEARSRAGGGGLSSRAVLGIGEPDETALGEVHLVSLGVRVRRVEADRRAVRIDTFLASPTSGQVLVHRRAWIDEPCVYGAALSRRPALRGVTAGALAGGQVVTRSATRGAHRELRFSSGARADTSVTPQTGRWERLGAALCPPDLSALRAQLEAMPPSMLGARVLADRVRAVPVRGVRALGFSAAQQTLHARLVGPRGGELPLRLVQEPARGPALDAAVRALREGVRFVSGELRRQDGALVIEPIAMVTDRVVVLDLADEAPSPLPSALAPAPADPLEGALAEALACLDEAAHRGLRHLPGHWHQARARAAGRLAELGLARCAAGLRALADPTAEAWLAASLRLRVAQDLPR